MPGLPPSILRPQMALFAKWAFSPKADWPTTRKRLELGLAFPPPPRKVAIRPAARGGVSVYEVQPPGALRDRFVIHFHGGGYTTGSAKTHRAMTAAIASGAQARGVVVDYRLAPEHPYPAAIEDAKAVWRDVTGSGVPAGNVALTGDSAGAGIAMALTLSLRDEGAEGPGALGLVCPWLDLTPDGARARPDAPKEPILSPDLLDRFARGYLTGGADPSDPLVSPLLADLHGLPPVVLHSGADDLLVTDARRFEEKATAAGVSVEHRCYANLWHDFHLNFATLGGEGGDAPQVLGASLARHLGGSA